jgi:hypothetical protein
VVKGQTSIDFLRARSQANDSPGLWELDADDVPEVTELLAEMATADVDRVREILSDEEAGPKRMIILETCRPSCSAPGVSERRPGREGRRSRDEHLGRSDRRGPRSDRRR